jgi:hypothetical protein
MRRILVVSLSFALLGALAWAVAPPSAPRLSKAGSAALAAGAPVKPAAPTIVDKLYKRSKFDAIEQDKNYTLRVALAKLAKDHGVTFEVNENAFAADGLADPLQAPITQHKGLPARETTLARRLEQVLARLTAPSGATFMVRRDHIEITTGDQQAAEVVLPRHDALVPAGMIGQLQLQIGQLQLQVGGGAQRGGVGVLGPVRSVQVPLVSLFLERRPLTEAVKRMQEQVHVNIVIDPRAGDKAKALVSGSLLNMPVDSALFLLADLAELRPVRLDNTYLVTTPERAKALREAWQKHQPKGRALKVPPAAPAAEDPGAGGM